MEAFPLHWPIQKARTQKADRQPARFGTRSAGGYRNKLTLAAAVSRVMSELSKYTPPGHTWRIDPKEIIISTNVPLKKDGFPYSSWKQPEDPGAAVYFSLDGFDICLPCDKWDRVEDNLGAIAAHIKAMRDQEGWGVGETRDVFAGFPALPETSMTEVDTWAILGLSGRPASAEELKKAYKKVVPFAHPDTGGSAEEFQTLQKAYQYAQNIMGINL